MRQVLDRINAFLDKYVLPWPVRFLTNRFVILITISLLIPLIVLANNTVLVLSINSYLNTMSVAVSSIVLLYATVAEIRQRQIAEMQEKRAQEDHQHIVETHTWMMRALTNQQQELEELKALLASGQGQTYERQSVPEVPDVRAMHPQGAARFETNYVQKKLAHQMKRNPFAAELRRQSASPDQTPTHTIPQ